MHRPGHAYDPGPGFFYGGMVSRKNVLATMMQSFAVVAVSIQWVLWGDNLAFGPDKGGIIGGLEWSGLRGVGVEPGIYVPTIPHLAFMVFQGMFAVITPALITGAFAERMRFQAFLLFVVLWATLVYDPIAHWVWAEGGGSAAWGRWTSPAGPSSTSARARPLWRRLGFGREPKEPHDLTMVVLGAASGAVAGLVAITPASGFVTPGAAILIGLGAGALCYCAVRLRNRWRIDDSLDVWGVHGVGRHVGAVARGLFATVAVNSAGADGLFYGNAGLVVKQGIAVAATAVYSFVMTWAILRVVDKVAGLRVRETDEVTGLDLAEHGEMAYQS